MEVELKLTKKELEYLYFAIENYRPLNGIEDLPVEEQFELYESTKNKIEHEFIADHIFDLLNDLESLAHHLEGNPYDEWCDKLWYDEQEDANTTLVKRDPKMWTWDTVGKMQALVEQLQGELQ